jgi:outer membrane protein assembly factor BamD
MRRNSFYIIILLVVFTSCSGYEKILKSSDYNLKYRKAFQYYHREDYTRALGIFEQIATVFRGTSKADSVSFYQGMCAYKLENYTEAQYYFSSYAQTYAYNPLSEEAEYLAAYCLYKDSPVPSLDQDNTVKGIEAFSIFLRKHPESKYAEQTKLYLAELQDKLVEKSRLSAKLYYDMGMYKSSIIALKNSLEDYPNTKYREEMMWLILDSNFQLAENSVESKKKDRYQATIDEYYSFVSEFPQSRLKKDADRIYEKSQNMIK